jgi:DNA ligase (NAD+)
MADNPYLNAPFPDFEPVEDLGKKEADRQVRMLREALRHHNDLYYVKSDPEISDQAYDTLFHRLQELEEAFPKLKSDLSPTRRVGTRPLSGLKKKKHRAPLLSLDSSQKEENVRRFFDSVSEHAGDRSPEWVL